MKDTKIAILILGAPRSGTSLISHVISELGFYFGEPERFVDPVTHPWNPIFFELQSLNDLNDEIAQALGANFLDFDWFPLKEDFNDELILGFEKKIEQQKYSDEFPACEQQLFRKYIFSVSFDYINIRSHPVRINFSDINIVFYLQRLCILLHRVVRPSVPRLRHC